MSLPVITVEGTIKDSHQDVAVGHVVFTLTSQLHDTVGDIVYIPVEEVAELDEDGSFSIDLVASQGAGANPSGVAYRVRPVIEGRAHSHSYTVILDEDMVSPVNLADLPPAGEASDWNYPQMVPTPLPVLGAVIDGGGDLITTGDKRAPVSVPVECRITGWRVIGDVPGEITVDIYKSTLADYPPDSGDSITASAPIEVVGEIIQESDDVDTWDEINAGDILEFAVVWAVDFRWVRIELFVETS